MQWNICECTLHFDFCFLKGKGKINDQGNTWSGTGQNKVIKYERWELLNYFFTTTTFSRRFEFWRLFLHQWQLWLLFGNSNADMRPTTQPNFEIKSVSINWSYFSKAYFLPITTWNDSITSFLHGQHGILDNYANFFFLNIFSPKAICEVLLIFGQSNFFSPQFRGFDNWHLCFV